MEKNRFFGWGNKKEACVYASVSNRTMDKWIAAGLPVARVGSCMRIRFADIDRFLENHLVNKADTDLENCMKIADEMARGIMQ